MKLQGTPTSQNNLKEEGIGRTHISQFQNLLQRYSNQNNVVLAYR